MRGGKRPGAGRPKGIKELKSKLDMAKFQFEMQQFVPVAIAALVDVAENGKSESAPVSAATEILNRAVGRPTPADETGNLFGDAFRIMFEEGPEVLEEEGLGPLLKMPVDGLFD